MTTTIDADSDIDTGEFVEADYEKGFVDLGGWVNAVVEGGGMEARAYFEA